MISDLTLRLARAPDARAIAILSREQIERGLPWSWTPARVQRAIEDGDTNVLVALGGAGSVRGFGIMNYGDEQAHLSLLAVHPSQWRRGVGSAMVHWLESVATTAGIAEIVLEARAANIVARDFYRRLGYEEVRLIPGYYQGREAAVRMCRALVARQSAEPPPA